MLLLVAAALSATPPPTIMILPGAWTPPAKMAQCQRTSAYVAGAGSRYDGKPAMPRNLTELPTANMYVAVYRVDGNGCLAPIVVQYRVGGR